MGMMSQLKKLQEKDLVKIQYWDHVAVNFDDEETTEKDHMVDTVGFFHSIVYHKKPLVRVSMNSDLSFPHMYILIPMIEKLFTLTEHSEE